MSKREYTVGRGKPPAHSRWRKGQSGNPSGGRKRKPTLLQELERVLGEKIGVTEDGKRRKISKEEALIRRVVAGALNGDKKFAEIVLNYMKERDVASSEDSPSVEVIMARTLMKLSWQDWQL